ncbi:MAG: LEA type 2 family protein [Bacteroidales bacterium]|nr:LEA type 2 family protein [Bacteroidales bacterium]
MKNRSLILIIFVLGIITVSSCKKDKLFEQPTIEITGYTLKELPGEYTYLEIDMIVTNNDDRDAHIKDVEYQVEIEGVTSETEKQTIDKEISDTPLELTLPLTLLTNDAVKLLAKLDAGEQLNYTATGTFHVDDPILKLFDLPIDVTGTANVEAGFEDFYEQPEVTVDNISVKYTGTNKAGATFDFDVACTVQNMDSRGITIDEVEYVVYIEGIKSVTHLYSDSYSSEFSIAGNGTESLNLPVTLNLNSEDGTTLAQAIESGTINYSVEGTFHAVKVDGTTVDFVLPLYVTGNVSADVVSNLFQQPTIEITGYTLLELPGEFTNLEIAMIVTNNDIREAFIKDIEYQVDIEGVISETEQVVINQTLLTDTPLNLTLPLTLLTTDALQLLTILDAGQSLNYHATGVFHVDEPVLDLFDLPVDITGTASVDVGFEDFYEQPETTVNSINGSYTTSGFPVPVSYTFDLDVNCDIQNMDSRDVIIDEVEYVVYVEGKQSETHLYSDTYSTDLSIAGNGTVSLTLPVLLILNSTEGLQLAQALLDGYADYVIEGTFHVINADGTAADFVLPLYDEGTVPASVVAGK